MDQFQEQLRELQEWEIRKLLNEVLNMTALSASNEEGEERSLADKILKVCGDHYESARKRQAEAEDLQSQVHLVFSLSDSGSLKVALSEIGKRQENKVLAFNDLFSVGPIMHLDKAEGQQHRLNWLIERFPDYKYGDLINQDQQITRMIDTLGKIPENKSITVWCADNAHDQTGLRFALYVLKERKQPISVINLSELSLNIPTYSQENGPPYAQGVIEPDVFREIVKRSYEVRPLETEQRRSYESEWLTISSQGHMLRLWQNGEIKGQAEDALDRIILAAINYLQIEATEDGFVKTGYVVANIFETTHQLVGFAFIEYRIWTLISNGILAFKGLPGAMHQYSIRVL
jgi:hypothetical protein